MSQHACEDDGDEQRYADGERVERPRNAHASLEAEDRRLVLPPAMSEEHSERKGRGQHEERRPGHDPAKEGFPVSGLQAERVEHVEMVRMRPRGPRCGNHEERGRDERCEQQAE